MLCRESLRQVPCGDLMGIRKGEMETGYFGDALRCYFMYYGNKLEAVKLRITAELQREQLYVPEIQAWSCLLCRTTDARPEGLSTPLPVGGV